MHKHRTFVLLASIGIVAAPRTACAQRPAQAVARVAAHSADSVRIGCSGGVTGNGSGNTLTRSGERSAYVRPLRAVATHTPLERDSAASAAVFRELDRVRFRTLQFNVISNMTCVLELTDRQGQHTVSWAIHSPPQELAPVIAALRRAFGDERQVWP